MTRMNTLGRWIEPCRSYHLDHHHTDHHKGLGSSDFLTKIHRQFRNELQEYLMGIDERDNPQSEQSPGFIPAPPPLPQTFYSVKNKNLRGGINGATPSKHRGFIPQEVERIFTRPPLSFDEYTSLRCYFEEFVLRLLDDIDAPYLAQADSLMEELEPEEMPVEAAPDCAEDIAVYEAQVDELWETLTDPRTL